MNTSKLFNLNYRDIALSFLIAFIGGAIAIISQFLTQCGIACIDWMNVLDAGLVAGVAYLIKNFFSDGQGDFAGVKFEK